MYAPVQVKRGELVRIYLVNMVELDPINSFHIHGNFFHRFPTGTSLEPLEYTDTVIQGQGQRDVLELRFPYTGKYMFHAHKSEFAALGLDGVLRGGGVSGRLAACCSACPLGLLIADRRDRRSARPWQHQAARSRRRCRSSRAILRPGEIELVARERLRGARRGWRR